MATNEELLVSLRHAARELTAQRRLRDLEQTLSHIVAAAVATVPGVEAGGISITEGADISSRSPTDAMVSELDALQSRLGEGPCISAILEPPADGIVVADDLAGRDGERQPEFAARAVESGFHALMSTQLSTHGEIRAALTSMLAPRTPSTPRPA